MAQAFASIIQGERVLTVQDATPYVIHSADNEPERNTYRAFVYGLAPTGAVTDILILGGAAGKVVRLKSITVSGAATAATNIGVYVFKRTTAATGGTPVAVTKTASDLTDPAASATLNSYAGGAPTVGSGTMLDGCRLNLAPAANGSIDRFMFQYTWQNDKAAVLRAASDAIAVGLNGQIISGVSGVLDIAITWTEE